MMTEPFPSQHFEIQPDTRPLSVLAITSLVLGILFLCFGPLALIPLVLGIIGITKTGANGSKKGMGFAIAGVSLGGVGVLGTCMSIGILLPSLGAARAKATELKSVTQIRTLAQGAIIYAGGAEDVFPTQEQWPDALIDLGVIEAGVLISPAEDGDGVSYIYVPGPHLFDADQILLYEDPKHFEDGVLVGFADGHVEMVDHAEFVQMLDEQLEAQSQEP